MKVDPGLILQPHMRYAQCPMMLHSYLEPFSFVGTLVLEIGNFLNTLIEKNISTKKKIEKNIEKGLTGSAIYTVGSTHLFNWRTINMHETMNL